MNPIKLCPENRIICGYVEKHPWKALGASGRQPSHLFCHEDIYTCYFCYALTAYMSVFSPSWTVSSLRAGIMLSHCYSGWAQWKLTEWNKTQNGKNANSMSITIEYWRAEEQSRNTLVKGCHSHIWVWFLGFQHCRAELLWEEVTSIMRQHPELWIQEKGPSRQQQMVCE